MNKCLYLDITFIKNDVDTWAAIFRFKYVLFYDLYSSYCGNSCVQCGALD